MSDEKEAVNAFEETMKEFDNVKQSETEDGVEHRGDSAFSSKEEFGKKVTYIPCAEHSVRKLFEDAKELCTESSNIEAMGCNIGITFVYPCITKRTYAHICKPNRLLKMYAGYDLILEISGQAWDRMTDVERMALLHHELEHVNYREKPNGDLDLRLIDHNVKDFDNILDLYGIYYIRAGLNEDVD